MELSEELLKALAVFTSNVSSEKKKKTIVSSLSGGATEDQVSTFLQKRRTLNDLLDFIAAYRIDRPSLPLNLMVHIRHTVHNQFLRDDTMLPVECSDPNEPWILFLPDELQYVMRRIPDSLLPYHTQCGFVVVSKARRDVLQAEMRSDDGRDSIWNRHAAVVVGEKYMGMGHYVVVGLLLHPPSALFAFPAGGSNGYDREDSLQHAKTLTEDTVMRIEPKELTCLSLPFG